MIRRVGSQASDSDLRQTEKSTIRKVVGLSELAQIQSPVTAIFLHYHPDEYVAPGFAKLVQSAAESGFRTIFVSSSRPSRALPQLGNCPSLAYVHRHNYGYDFGALKDARDTLARHGLLGGGRYVVLNSSMLNLASAGFGSDWVLDELCAPSTKTDLLGVTASYEVSGYHIQTYYYSVSSEWFCSRECENFFHKYEKGLAKTKLLPRDYAIQSGELGLSITAMRAGYAVRSIFDDLCLPTKECYDQVESLQNSLKKLLPSLESYEIAAGDTLDSNPSSHQYEWLPRLGLQSNPSQSCWALLLFRKFFFLKRELLELKSPAHHPAPSVVALLMPVLDACEVKLPDWSDVQVLPRLIHASKTKVVDNKYKNKLNG